MKTSLKPSKLVAALLAAPLCAFGYMSFFILRTNFQEGFSGTSIIVALIFLGLFGAILLIEIESIFTELDNQGVKQLRVRHQGKWFLFTTHPWQEVTSYRLSGHVCELSYGNFNTRLNLASFNDWEEAKAFVERRLSPEVMRDALENQAMEYSQAKPSWWQRWRTSSNDGEIEEEIGMVSKVRRFATSTFAALGFAASLWMMTNAFYEKEPIWPLATGIFFLTMNLFWIARIVESYSVVMDDHGVSQIKLIYNGRAVARPFLAWHDIEEVFAHDFTCRLRTRNLEIRVNFSAFRNWRNADLYVWNRLPSQVKSYPWSK